MIKRFINSDARILAKQALCKAKILLNTLDKAIV